MLHAKCCKQCYIQDNVVPDRPTSLPTLETVVDIMLSHNEVFCAVKEKRISLESKVPEGCHFILEQMVYDDGFKKEKKK